MQAMSPAARWTLIASVVAGVSYVVTWGLVLPQPIEIAWKGAGVALQALHAAVRARSSDGWLLVGVMGLGALGDVLLEILGLTTGAVAFLLGHVVASSLYLRHRRAGWPAALVLVPAITAAAWLLPADRAAAAGIALYAAFLGLMAATALGSRFPMTTVGRGALMFVLSDLLIFARLGPLPDNLATGLAVWGLYYFGQMLICVGVTRALESPRTA